jgi:purine-nucleoside phosphorylase
MSTHSRLDHVTSLQHGVARFAQATICAAICVVVLFLSQPVRADEFKVLDAYTRYASSPAVNNPDDYIGWLKQQPQFQGGKLDNLPTRAIVLHYADVRKMLNGLGYGDSEVEEIQTGHTDSNVLFIVRPQAGRGFIVNRGMPGAGGISTQVAELGALGVRYAIHIGTAGLLGSRLPYASLIVSSGSYKDGAAFLLSSNPEEAAEQIAYPDAGLSDAIERQLARAEVTHARGLGFTSPVYYFQKVGLLKALLGFRFDPGKAPGFVEMEQASFFVTSRLSNVKSASIVAGSDRAVPTGDVVKQEFFEGDMDGFLALALRHAILTLSEQP